MISFKHWKPTKHAYYINIMHKIDSGRLHVPMFLFPILREVFGIYMLYRDESIRRDKKLSIF